MSFKGLSNDTTLMQIQSGRTVPLKSKTPDTLRQLFARIGEDAQLQ